MADDRHDPGSLPRAGTEPHAGPQSGSGPAPRYESQMVGPKLLESLVCPATGGRLEYDPAKGELVSRTAMLAFPIRSGIPIMLIDEARKIEG